MLGNRSEAEDATQDIFLKVHRSLGTFRGESKISTWIFRIAANVCISRLRRKQHPVESLESLADTQGNGFQTREPVVDENPEDVYAKKEMADLIRDEVRSLPPLWAQAISLHYFGGESYDDIAEAMDIPRGTVATYISRGKNQLAEMLRARLGEGAAIISLRN